MANVSADQWHIGLDAWIIQDGNYGDFYRGQTVEFALEFYSQNLTISATTTKQAQHLGDGNYQVAAQVMFVATNVWVIDFGVSAYREAAPLTGVTVGSFVSGQLHLGVDPFFYMEYLFRQQGMQPLIYTWHVDRIQRQAAPLIETLPPSGGKLLTRDPTQLGYIDLEETNAWQDDQGDAEYLLSCSGLSHNPKSRPTAM